MSSQTQRFLVEKIKVKSILDLPDFLLKLIFLKLTFCERLAFSMLSKRANQIMLNLNLPREDPLQIEISEIITIMVDSASFVIHSPTHPLRKTFGSHISVSYTRNEKKTTTIWRYPIQCMRFFMVNLFLLGGFDEISTLDFGPYPLIYPMAFINEMH